MYTVINKHNRGIIGKSFIDRYTVRSTTMQWQLKLTTIIANLLATVSLFLPIRLLPSLNKIALAVQGILPIATHFSIVYSVSLSSVTLMPPA